MPSLNDDDTEAWDSVPSEEQDNLMETVEDSVHQSIHSSTEESTARTEESSSSSEPQQPPPKRRRLEPEADNGRDRPVDAWEYIEGGERTPSRGRQPGVAAEAG